MNSPLLLYFFESQEYLTLHYKLFFFFYKLFKLIVKYCLK